MRDGPAPEMGDREPDPGIFDLLRELWGRSDVQLRGEWSLAKAEVSQKLRQVVRGIAFLIGAVLLALFALGTLVFTVVASLIAFGLAPWVAGLLVTATLCLVIGILAALGVRAFSDLGLRRTVRSVKSDFNLMRRGPSDVRRAERAAHDA